MGSIPTLVRVFLCPCVGPFPSVGLTLTWFIWGRNLALHITFYSVNSVYDNTQLCISFKDCDVDVARLCVENCVADICF